MRCAMMAGRPIRVGMAQPFVHHDLRGAQHAFFLAFSVSDALLEALRGREDRLHRSAAGVDEALQRSR